MVKKTLKCELNHLSDELKTQSIKPDLQQLAVNVCSGMKKENILSKSPFLARAMAVLSDMPIKKKHRPFEHQKLC